MDLVALELVVIQGWAVVKNTGNPGHDTSWILAPLELVVIQGWAVVENVVTPESWHIVDLGAPRTLCRDRADGTCPSGGWVPVPIPGVDAAQKTPVEDVSGAAEAKTATAAVTEAATSQSAADESKKNAAPAAEGGKSESKEGGESESSKGDKSESVDVAAPATQSAATTEAAAEAKLGQVPNAVTPATTPLDKRQASFTSYVTALTLLPVESPAKLKTNEHLRQLVETARNATTDLTLEELGNEIAAQKEIVTQMISALRSVIKSLTTARGRREKDQAIARRREEDKVAQDAAKLQKSSIQREKAETLRKRDARVFSMDFKAAGHAELPTVDEADQLKDPEANEYAAPFIVPVSKVHMGLSADSTANTFMTKWHTAFPSSQTATQTFRCAAPVTTAHGQAELYAVMKGYVPPPDDRLPPEAAHDVRRLWWFGLTEHHAKFDIEPSGLGSARYISKGSVMVVAAPVYGLMKFATDASRKDVSAHKPQTIEELASFCSSLDDSTLARLAKDQTVYYGHVREQHILFIPPGYIVGLCAMNQQQVSGVRLPFTKSPPERLSENLCQIVDLSPAGQSETFAWTSSLVCT